MCRRKKDVASFYVVVNRPTMKDGNSNGLKIEFYVSKVEMVAKVGKSGSSKH